MDDHVKRRRMDSDLPEPDPATTLMAQITSRRRAHANRLPADKDAEIVLALKAQGAVVLGKVHTTEYAFFDPSPARYHKRSSRRTASA